MTKMRNRPLLVGTDAVEAPFPVFLRGPVVKGFGRGGKELGIPTGISDDIRISESILI